MIEVCAGSLTDCINAQKGGANRIELNSAVHLGGLTPSLGTLIQAKQAVSIPIITMIRPRPGGFHYNDDEIAVMYEDAKLMLEHGADGLVFGFLNDDFTVDTLRLNQFTALCHQYQKEAIFHRAFDCVSDPFIEIEALIDCGIHRVLTSGNQDKVSDGVELLKQLNHQYGHRIEFCMGSGITVENAKHLIQATGIKQIHGSFKGWYTDPTTQGTHVSYRYSDSGDYDGVDINALIATKHSLSA